MGLFPAICQIIMAVITLVNATSSKIEVRITKDNDEGETSFYVIDKGQSETWERAQWQVAFIWRGDNDKTETLVVKPGKTYQID